MLRSVTAWLVLAGIAILVALALLVLNGLTEPFDAAVIGFVRQPALDAPLAPLATITQLGSTVAVTALAVIVLVVLALRGNPRWGLASAATIGVASLLNAGFKRWIERARPDVLDPLVVEHGFSFPSGHSMLGATAWGIVAVVIARSDMPVAAKRAGVGVCIALVALIGLSRVYLGVHYPSDVLAGWTAGAVIVLLYAAATRQLARPRLAVSAAPAERGAPAADEDRAARRSDPPARR
ncbi:MAG: phosphatase PAP2 family protein [Chloroflexota bacterium]